MTIFIVNGEERNLELRDGNGIDYSADFIGNNDPGMDIDEDGNYIATQEDFEWWKSTIASHKRMQDMIAQYKAANDPDVVDQVVQDWIGGVDLEYQLVQVAMGLEQAFGTL